MAAAIHPTFLGLCGAALAIVIWSGSFVLLRLGVTTGLTAYDLAFLRFGVAGLILAPVLLRRGTGSSRLGLPGAVTMIVAFGAPYVLLLSLGMNTASASAAGSLNPGAMALSSVVLGWAIFGDDIGIARLFGIIWTAIGVALFAYADGPLSIGHIIFLGTGIMWTGYTLTTRYRAVPALNATAIVAVGSAVFYAPIYLFALPKQIMVVPISDVLLQAVFQGVLVSVVAVYAFTRSVELLGAAASILPALIPVVTLGLGALIVGESAGAAHIIPAVFVTIGLVFILVGKRIAHWTTSYYEKSIRPRFFS